MSSVKKNRRKSVFDVSLDEEGSDESPCVTPPQDVSDAEDVAVPVPETPYVPIKPKPIRPALAVPQFENMAHLLLYHYCLLTSRRILKAPYPLYSEQ
jgi:hypothetical protein